MKHLYLLVYAVLAILILNSCASKTTRYLNSSDQLNEPFKSPEVDKDYRSFFLLGNTGQNENGPDESFLNTFDKLISKNVSEDDYLVFLGDNIYANKLKKKENKQQIDKLLDLVQGFNGKSLFIPGENDWNDKGLKGLEDVEDYVEEVLGKDNTYLPENGCPIEIIDLSFDTEIIIVDSQWYIEDWSKQAEFNKKCEIKTREKFLKVLEDKLRKARHKNVLIMMHHPVYSNGIYGGEVSNDILINPKPENLFVPVAGSAWTFLRTQGGLSKQDLLNPMLNELITEVKLIAKQAPRVFVLSGHEQSLQYIVHDNFRQIISGSTTKSESVRLGKDGHFASGSQGFAELRLFEDQSSQIIFYEFDEDTNTFKTIFKKEAFAAPEPFDINALPNTFPATVKTTIYPPERTNVTEKYEKVFGEHYRYLYGKELTVKTVDLDTLYGGLKVERNGGGNQTEGLRLIGKGDREYNMRAIAKDGIRFLQSKGYNDLDPDFYFKGTVPLEVLEDFYTASHPFGAFAIPRLAGAIGLGHTHPKLFYVPKQKALGDFNKLHGDRLYMIVEKPDSDFNSNHMFGYNVEVESTDDLFEELRKDENNIVDEKEYIKARIFDLLIGDWDRHEDQWRWALLEDTENTGKNVYIPIPRDRDQVFSKFDGSFIELLKKTVGQTQQLALYGPDIRFIDPFSESALDLDRAILQKTDLDDWYAQIELIQNNITPEVVDKAFAEMPVEAHDEITEGIKKDFLARKANLKDIVERFYKNVITFQTLLGTDKDDHIIITNLKKGKVRVEGYRIKDGKDADLLFDRTFDDNKTNRVWIYGLNDNDIFDVIGKRSSNIDIIIAGGQGEDTFNIAQGNSRKITVYDQEGEGNTIINRGGARFRINDVYENHIYNQFRRPGKSGLFGVNINYNPDNGAENTLLLGRDYNDFEGNPFKNRFELKTTYFSLTQAFNIEGHAHFAHLFHDWNLKLSSRVTTNNFTENFFGLGNNTTNQFSNYDANRIFTRHITGGVSAYYDGEYGSSFELGTKYHNVSTEESQFIDAIGIGARDEYILALANYEYLSTNQDGFKNRGMHFKAYNWFSDNLSNNQTTLAINPQLTFWNAIDSSRDVILKTSASAQLRIGEGIPFYQSARIGGEETLRSYRLQRFTGEQAVTASADLQYNFKPMKTQFLPLRSLIYAGFDTGRVWVDNQDSNKWHNSYGGGLVALIAGLETQLSYFYGEDGGRLAFKFSFGL